MQEFFVITSVSRDDIRAIGRFRNVKDVHLPDGVMDWISRKMADRYLECCYWIALEHLAEEALEDMEISIGEDGELTQAQEDMICNHNPEK